MPRKERICIEQTALEMRYLNWCERRGSYWRAVPERFLRKAFNHKEARETHYWIRLLKDTNYLSDEQCGSLLKDIDELLKIIGSIQKTMRNS